jgi:hypothetical protein
MIIVNMSVSCSSFFMLFSAIACCVVLFVCFQGADLSYFIILSGPPHEESLSDGVDIVNHHLEVDRSLLFFAPLFELGAVKIL